MSERAAHWESVYQRKKPDEVSWYRAHLERSLAFVDQAALGREAALIDVGGGASTFVDDLVARGFESVSVLDLSASAIETAKRRLGAEAGRVRWLVGDVTDFAFPEHAYDFWHDRAVFHFLQDPLARQRYVAQVRRAVKPGGHVVVATFGPQGPQRCSGLDVMRYDADQLHGEFGSDFAKVDSAIELHATPSGSQQQFVYCYCRVSASR
jgi:ubiquinone/menaquinone biosynthesis C-methylase UbiE